jgi:predicted GNAT family acetyltransferase
LYDVATDALDVARTFLVTQPLLNNLVLTLLVARATAPQPGRYWIAFEREQVVGVALQSPLNFPVNLASMKIDIAAALADAVAAAGGDVPGAFGEAATVARFAGQLAERRHTGAYPTDGQRVYEAPALTEGTTAAGMFERAGTADCPLIVDWVGAFQSETGARVGEVAEFVARRVDAGEIWLWNDNGFRCMAACTQPIACVSRVQYVYSPPEFRRRGYAGTLVRHLTRQLLNSGVRPMLFTDLRNPTSNSIYRSVGYQPVAELVRYCFDRSL